MTCTIRPAQADDAPVLEEIERTCFVHDPWIASDFLRWRCLVAEVNGQVVGFVAGHQVFAGADKQLPEHEILNVAVLPAHRRLGIGRALLEEETRAAGIYTLEVRASNSSAQTLYRRLGFQQVGERPYYYQSPTENAIVMRLERC